MKFVRVAERVSDPETEERFRLYGELMNLVRATSGQRGRVATASTNLLCRYREVLAEEVAKHLPKDEASFNRRVNRAVGDTNELAKILNDKKTLDFLGSYLLGEAKKLTENHQNILQADKADVAASAVGEFLDKESGQNIYKSLNGYKPGVTNTSNPLAYLKGGIKFAIMDVLKKREKLQTISMDAQSGGKEGETGQSLQDKQPDKSLSGVNPLHSLLKKQPETYLERAENLIKLSNFQIDALKKKLKDEQPEERHWSQKFIDVLNKKVISRFGELRGLAEQLDSIEDQLDNPNLSPEGQASLDAELNKAKPKYDGILEDFKKIADENNLSRYGTTDLDIVSELRQKEQDKLIEKNTKDQEANAISKQRKENQKLLNYGLGYSQDEEPDSTERVKAKKPSGGVSGKTEVEYLAAESEKERVNAFTDGLVPYLYAVNNWPANRRLTKGRFGSIPLFNNKAIRGFAPKGQEGGVFGDQNMDAVLSSDPAVRAQGSTDAIFNDLFLRNMMRARTEYVFDRKNQITKTGKAADDEGSDEKGPKEDGWKKYRQRWQEFMIEDIKTEPALMNNPERVDELMRHAMQGGAGKDAAGGSFRDFYESIDTYARAAAAERYRVEHLGGKGWEALGDEDREKMAHYIHDQYYEGGYRPFTAGKAGGKEPRYPLRTKHDDPDTYLNVIRGETSRMGKPEFKDNWAAKFHPVGKRGGVSVHDPNLSVDFNSVHRGSERVPGLAPGLAPGRVFTEPEEGDGGELALGGEYSNSNDPFNDPMGNEEFDAAEPDFVATAKRQTLRYLIRTASSFDKTLNFDAADRVDAIIRRL